MAPHRYLGRGAWRRNVHLPQGTANPGTQRQSLFHKKRRRFHGFYAASFSLPGTKGFERTTTDAHQMALAVVFESGWQNIGASPEALNKTRAKDFLRNLPAAWDDIHFIEGHPDTHCVVARRKGSNWYIAGINTEEPKKLSISLDFLKEGTYEVILYSDNKEGKVITSEMQISTIDRLEVEMMRNGGFGVMVANSN